MDPPRKSFRKPPKFTNEPPPDLRLPSPPEPKPRRSKRLLNQQQTAHNPHIQLPHTLTNHPEGESPPTSTASILSKLRQPSITVNDQEEMSEDHEQGAPPLHANSFHGGQEDEENRCEETNQSPPHKGENRSQSPTKGFTSNHEQSQLGKSQDPTSIALVLDPQQLTAVNLVTTVNSQDEASQPPMDCTPFGPKTASPKSQQRELALVAVTCKIPEIPSQILTTCNHAHHSQPTPTYSHQISAPFDSQQLSPLITSTPPTPIRPPNKFHVKRSQAMMLWPPPLIYYILHMPRPSTLTPLPMFWPPPLTPLPKFRPPPLTFLYMLRHIHSKFQHPLTPNNICLPLIISTPPPPTNYCPPLTLSLMTPITPLCLFSKI